MAMVLYTISISLSVWMAEQEREGDRIGLNETHFEGIKLCVLIWIWNIMFISYMIFFILNYVFFGSDVFPPHVRMFSH